MLLEVPLFFIEKFVKLDNNAKIQLRATRIV